ncbi:MAG: NifB/NifX family molybdenum-iron cluster-binding protein [Actinomycetota bacterium]|nr:NifB/NifX family molybdenum-iron cluster-binding protein [Actinomycetota bacterium]
MGAISLKIAIAVQGSEVSPHFGRCERYLIIEIEGGEVKRQRVIPNPGHRPGFLPGYLAEMGVEAIIAGGMGPRAKDLFAKQGIEVITGVTGELDEALNRFLAGNLEVGQNTCHH